jgi:hypothetical protein
VSHEFAIGKLVIAKNENGTNPAIGNVRGLEPGAGDAVRMGQAGELMDGPFIGVAGETRWDVKWANGGETMSRQDALLVIGDKSQDASLTDNTPSGKVTA